MSPKNLNLRVCLLALLALAIASTPMFAGSAIIGSLAGSSNTTVAGQAVLPNTTLYSGDSLQVRDGLAVVALDKGSKVIFGRETVASFLREADDVTVLLGRGSLSLYHPAASIAMGVKAGDISITPAKGFITEGEIAMANGAVVISTREGMLRVESQGRVQEVAKGKALTVKAGVARSPQAGGAGVMGGRISSSTALSIGTIGANGLSAGLAGGAISRSDSATTALNTALSNVTNASNTVQQATSSSEGAQAAATGIGNGINAINQVLNPGTPSPFAP